MGLAQTAVKGTVWSAVGQGSTILLQFAVTAILARLLSPADFGLMAMVLVVVNFAMMFSELGMSAPVIQRREVSPAQLSSVFAVNVLAGVGLTAVIFGLAGPLGWAFGEPRVAPLLRAASLTYVLSAPGITHRALLQKRLQFRRLAVTDLVGASVYGVVSIGCAFAGLGVWSLVAGSLAQQAARTLALWLLDDWRPHAREVSFRQLGAFWGFALNVTAERFVNYLQANLDRIIIGRLLGSLLLGYYDLAYRLVTYPLMRISPIVGQVAFPTFALIQADKQRVGEGYYKGVKYIALVTFPLLGGLLVFAPEFVAVVYGPAWGRTALLIRLLCLAGLMKSVGTTVGSIFYSQDRSDLALKWNLCVLAVYAAVIPPSALGGLETVAAAVSGLSAVLVIACQVLVDRILGMRLRDFFKALAEPALTTAGMMVVVAVVRAWLLAASVAAPWILAAGVAAGAAAYTVLVRLVAARTYAEVVQLIRLLLPARSGGVACR